MTDCHLSIPFSFHFIFDYYHTPSLDRCPSVYEGKRAMYIDDQYRLVTNLPCYQSRVLSHSLLPFISKPAHYAPKSMFIDLAVRPLKR